MPIYIVYVTFSSNQFKIGISLVSLTDTYLRIPKTAGYQQPPQYDPEQDAARQRQRLISRLAIMAGFSDGEASFYLDEHQYSYDAAWAAVCADREWERQHGQALRAQRAALVAAAEGDTFPTAPSRSNALEVNITKPKYCHC